MKIEGTLRKGEEFSFVDSSLDNKAPLVSLVEGGAIVSRYFGGISHLPDETPVIACWHGQWRTDGFLTTVGELRAKAKPLSEKHEADKKARAAERKATKGK